jgi:two-component sensor histidine kinase
VIAFSALALSAVCGVPGVVLLLSRARYGAAYAYVALLALDAAVILVPKAHIRAKMLVVASTFFIFGLSSLALLGPMGQRGIGFTLSVALCGLYVGFRPALAFACLGLAAGVGAGALSAAGLVSWPLSLPLPLESWIVQSLDIFIMDLILAIAASTLIEGVRNSFKARSEAEERTRKSLAEKETLLRELYHRTKNNMQVVSSLLKLSARELESGRDKAIFKDVTNKIVAMSLVHQKLYESRDLSNIGVADYVGELVELLMESYGASRDRIEVALDIEDRRMLIDTAVPLGLVISEILANSLKHAFPEGRGGRIDIALRTKGGVAELKVADDGIGLPAGFSVAADGRMGMKTLFTMVEHQMQGSIQFRSGPGLAYAISFKAELYDERV